MTRINRESITFLKSKLCGAVLEDAVLIRELFLKLDNRDLDHVETLRCIRFLKELLELGVQTTAGDGGAFWRQILGEHALLPRLADLLGNKDPGVRRACIDISLLLCDEECRKVLIQELPSCPAFLRRLFGVFLDYSIDNGGILQLQAALPMIMANPNQEMLPVFYESAERVLTSWLETSETRAKFPPPVAHIASFMELLSLSIHHHHRSFNFHHYTCLIKLINFISLLWNLPNPLPNNVLIAINKGILSILHLSNDIFHMYIAQRGVFVGILRVFSESNNLISSSILTLLHTILQLEITHLIDAVNKLWFEQDPGTASPHLKGFSFVQQLFYERHRSRMLSVDLS
eukprot:NODE_642_length_1545_cov_132.944519_g529_i0.p1 GENE.NODE_642_length_1545_cov_132.944519_g529_i0~~NODE_642_length_1545_cov_132.944519_g529_i0.p1  ORF type:complete len:346 (-),score=102.79 NODE_642_length_1545_cov_132.944519_g529_i0:429-1466(-)